MPAPTLAAEGDPIETEELEGAWSGSVGSGGNTDPTATTLGQASGTSDWNRWSAEEWAAWYMQQATTWWTTPTASTPTAMSAGANSGWRDPWLETDPWDRQWTRRDDDRTGGSDKIAVPEFTGEEDKEGVLTRGYLRKVSAWQRMTRLRPTKQALALYNNLSGRAWRDAEELDLARLDADDGVEVFTTWVSEKYLDREVVKVGRCMSEFFKMLRKSYNQDIREFNQEYDRQLSRLKEVGCNLPDVCQAWWYLDKLRLDNSAELNLLSSTGNQYSLAKLQEAAIIQDRMNRRLWEAKRGDKDRRGHQQQALVAEHDELYETEPEDVSDAEDEITSEGDPEAHEALVAFQNAKSKYQAFVRARGTVSSGGNGLSKEERIKQAKARSYCSVCKRRGHWHRDPECPANKGKQGNQPSTQTSHVCEIYVAEEKAETAEIYGITDCACSRTLAGVATIRKLRKYAKENKIPFLEVKQDESFKFGGDKLFGSQVAWVTWLSICGKWFLIKIAELDTDVPLLISRFALAALGMSYNLGEHCAAFTQLGLDRVDLGTTASGLPSVAVAAQRGPPPSWPNGLDWNNQEIYVPPIAVAYMLRDAAAEPSTMSLPQKLFYPKKLDALVYQKLTEENLCSEWFLGWWREHDALRDFWIEGDHYMDRIHVTPRKEFFDPQHWKTQDFALKSQLLLRLDEMRHTTCISCTHIAPPLKFQHEWKIAEPVHGRMLWIGRSRFKRSSSPSRFDQFGALCDPPTDVTGSMEDAPCRAAGSPGGARSGQPGTSDGAGTQECLHGDAWTSRQARTGTEQAHPGPTTGEMPRGEDPVSAGCGKRVADEDAPGESGDYRRVGGHVRAVQELPVQGGAGGLPGMGDQRVEEHGRVQPRPRSSGSLGGSYEVDTVQGRRLCESGALGTDTTTESVAATKGSSTCPELRTRIDSEDESGSQVTSREDRRFQEPEAEAGTGERGGILPGDVCWGGEDGVHYGRDCGAGEEASTVEGCQEDRGGGRGNVKRRIYWNKVNEAVRKKEEKRKKKIAEAEEKKDAAQDSGEEWKSEEVYKAEEDPAEEKRMPRVKLVYGDDFEDVRRLPRRPMKRAAKKRVQGLVKRTLSALMVTLSAFASAVAERTKDAIGAVLIGEETYANRADLLELFAGSAHLTEEFAAQGYNVLEPRDIRYGHDLFRLDQQNAVIDDLEKHRPKLVWIALPCTMWSPWQNINYFWRKEELRRLRRKQRKLVRFAVYVARLQLALGGDVVFEHPKGSAMWKDPSMAPIREDPRCFPVTLDMCRFNLRARSDNGLMRKPTTLLMSSEEIEDAVKLHCRGGHQHTPTAGVNTKPAGEYTREFCRRVVAGYKNLLKKFPHEAYPAEAVDGDDYEPSIAPEDGHDYQGELGRREVGPGVEEYGRRGPEDEGEHRVENPTGITFPDHVNKAVAQSLRRLHQNLGHPRREDLARHLRLAGAKNDVIQAAHSLKCATCQRRPNPGTRRPAKIVKNLSFNEEVGVDTIFLYTPTGTKLIGLSILDHASGYHVVRLVEGRKSEELVKAFLDGWASWAGLPERVVADQERGLMKDFTEELEHRHVKVDYIAGQAHWQNGAVERQNGWFRTIWDKTVDHMAITDEEAAWTVAQVCHAKNTLRRSHGYSPCQWVFGKDLAIHDGVLDEDAALLEKEQSVKPDDRRMREQAIRQAAREAFIQSQAEETVKRALLGRPRTMKRMYEQGDWVYVYRKSKNAGGAARIRGGAGEWMGPGTVVGREGDSYWVSRGGRCMLCAREHLRAAESEELGSIFQGEAMKEDLMRLADNMEINIDDDDLFKDATGPPDFPRSSPDEIPVRRYHEKAPPVMRKKRGYEEVEMEEDMAEALEETSRSRSRSPRTREAFRAHVAYSTSTTTRLSKTEQKQQDKEVKWHEIPEDEKEYYVEAEKKQWAEHLHYGACRPLNKQETEKVHQEVPRERILTSRFAYRDKNKAKRREDSTIPVKAKARLCIGGHRDPDLKAGMLVTEAPTATKLALSTLLFIAGQLQWKIAAGDVEAAFLNGNEARRNLYFSQPARGLPGLEPGALVEVIKGVFGLSTSPRLWWERLS